MAGPAYYTATINIAKNDDWIVSFVFTDGVDPIDLTGSTLKFSLKRDEAEHTAEVAANSPDNGITIEDAEAGEFSIVLLRPMLARLAPGEYVHDLVRLTPDGSQDRLFEGPAFVVEGVTR